MFLKSKNFHKISASVSASEDIQGQRGQNSAFYKYLDFYDSNFIFVGTKVVENKTIYNFYWVKFFIYITVYELDDQERATLTHTLHYTVISSVSTRLRKILSQSCGVQFISPANCQDIFRVKCVPRQGVANIHFCHDL